jgi:hypothetical protein
MVCSVVIYPNDIYGASSTHYVSNITHSFNYSAAWNQDVASTCHNLYYFCAFMERLDSANLDSRLGVLIMRQIAIFCSQTVICQVTSLKIARSIMRQNSIQFYHVVSYVRVPKLGFLLDFCLACINVTYPSKWPLNVLLA